MNGVLVGVFVYVLLQLVIGLLVSRRVRSESDYLIAGRSIDSLMNEAGLSQVALVKLDIEGAETAVFNSPRLDWLGQNRALIIEIHGRKAEAAVGSAMKQQGYRFYQRGDKFIYRRPSSIPSGQPC